MTEMVVWPTISRGNPYKINSFYSSTMHPGIHTPVGITGGTVRLVKPGAAGTAGTAGYQSITPTQAELQARLRAKLPNILHESIEARRIFPDPVQALVDLLGSMPGDYDTWREIIEEPYG